MVLAVRKQVDVLHNYNLRSIKLLNFILKCLIKHLRNFVIGVIHPKKDLLVHLRNSLWCIL